mgnify:FL=1
MDWAKNAFERRERSFACKPKFRQEFCRRLELGFACLKFRQLIAAISATADPRDQPPTDSPRLRGSARESVLNERSVPHATGDIAALGDFGVVRNQNHRLAVHFRQTGQQLEYYIRILDVQISRRFVRQQDRRLV